jgi:hypothetical protein
MLRRHIGRRGLVMLGVALWLAWGPTLGARTPAPPVTANKTVFVTALAGDYTPVTDLPAAAWRVQEDGIDRPIVGVTRATDPLDVVLLVDTSNSTQSSISELRAALVGFADALLDGRAGSTLSVMDVAGAAVLVADRQKTKAALDKTLSRTYADRTGGAVILEGMVEGAQHLVTSPSPRRAIVVVNLDGIPDQSNSTEPRTVVDHVVASVASVWAVSYQNAIARSAGPLGSPFLDPATPGSVVSAAGGLVGTANLGQNRDFILDHVPENTGGLRLTVAVPTALDGALQQVAAALLAQHAVTYTRPDDATPRVLRVTQPDAAVTLSYPSRPPQ